MLRPSPVPLPTSLVVKKGSKTRSRTSGGIPQPVSVTDSLIPAAAAFDSFLGFPNRGNSDSMFVHERGAASMGGAVAITRVELTAAELRAGAGRGAGGSAGRGVGGVRAAA